ncbi:hypothetical protein Tco_0512002 [Tanacetum coccineum]
MKATMAWSYLSLTVAGIKENLDYLDATPTLLDEIFHNLYLLISLTKSSIILHQLVEFFNDDFDPFVSFFYLFCLIKSRIPNNNTGEYTEVDDVDENIDWVDTDEEEGKNDDDDDKSIDLENTDDEETGDEFVHSNEYVNDDVDEEMNDADVAETKKGDEEIIDTAKKCFGNQFLNLSSNKSTFGNLKDTIDAEINSLLDIKIQFEVPHIQPPSILTVPVSMITEPSVLPPILETITTAPHVTSSITHGSSLGDTIHKVLQKHTADLIRQQSQKKSIDLEQEPTKSTLDIFKVKKEQTNKQKVTKYAIKSTDKAALS